MWADGNRDGMLQPPEIDELVRAAMRFLGEPHPANNPLDMLWGANRDGGIGPDEIDRVWMDIILPRLTRLLPTNPEAARLVDLNDDGRIVPDEARMVPEHLRSRAFAQPHRGSSPVDGRADFEHDGRVGTDEIAGFRDQIVRAAILLPEEGPAPGGIWVHEPTFRTLGTEFFCIEGIHLGPPRGRLCECKVDQRSRSAKTTLTT